ncbi:hypothetical protein J0H58_19545 [bacterium]|nr:hypothetical protein [bacterium]
MGDEAPVGRRQVTLEQQSVAMPPEVEAHLTRRVTVLLGLVPLHEMTQEEADWLFAQKVRPISE